MLPLFETSTDAFATRRAAYARLTGDGPTILFNRPTARRNGDVDYEYRSDSDFYYLTGIPEPGAALLLLPGDTPHSTIFVRPREPEREVWDGPRLGLDGARERAGADDALSIDELGPACLARLGQWERLYTILGRDPVGDQTLLGWMRPDSTERRRHGLRLRALLDASAPLSELRLRKDAPALALLRSSAEITAEAHVAAMRAARPGRREFELAAEIEYRFARRGARPGYPTIVGSGPNCTILHHLDKRREIKAGDLVLVDAGAECDCFTADVTRTFPASGTFSREQRQIYDVVLEAHRAAQDAARPGASFEAPHDAARRVLCRGMLQLGLLTGEPAQVLAGGADRRYFMHKTSHWLGLDVHDSGSYRVDGNWRPLEPGMVLTIEPGLYVSPTDELSPERFRGLGVRIEDDILITSEGAENLTSALVTDPGEIERVVRSGTPSEKGIG